MPRVCLLTSLAEPPAGDNARMLAPAFERLGWSVTRLPLAHLHYGASSVALREAPCPLADFDLIWILGFGDRGGFLDRMQLLAQAAPASRFVTRVEALLLLHGKFPGWLAAAGIPHPDTYTDSDATRLTEIARACGGRWVVKPSGGSFGRDVVIADADDPVLLRAMTRILNAAPGSQVLLQRHLDTKSLGEARVLVAGGRVIAAYARRPEAGAANLANGGEAALHRLSAAQRSVSERVAQRLLEQGVGYAGIDLVGDQVLEANIANPGGLATLLALEGTDHADAVVTAVLAARGRC